MKPKVKYTVVLIAVIVIVFAIGCFVGWGLAPAQTGSVETAAKSTKTCTYAWTETTC